MNGRRIVRKTFITYFFSFLCPAIIMALALFNTDIYPGGRNTIFIYDFKAQFLPTYASMRYLIDGESSFIYSFLGALGTNALPNYSMYLVNPFAWISVLFPLERLSDVFYFETLVETGLCGLTFCCYLIKGRNGKKNLFATFLFSCFYALMSYNVMYQMVLPWLLVVALLPMVLLGLEMIMDGKRGMLYIVSLTISLFLCYQMAYMTGIFSIIYIIFRMTERDFDRVRMLVRFAVCSLISLGLYLPAFIPTLIDVLNGRFEQKEVQAQAKSLFYYPIGKVLNQLFACRFDKIDAGGLPSLFCGTATLFFFALFFVLHRREKKKILLVALITVFYFFSMIFGPLNRMWHGFIEPNGYPGRYTYTFCAFLIIVAFDAMTLIAEKIKAPKSTRLVMATALAVVFLLEQYFNAASIIASYNIAKNYSPSIAYEFYVSSIQELIDRIDDEGFYRLGRGESKLCVNEGELFGVNELSYFSTAYPRDFMNTMGLLGMCQTEHYLVDVGSTPFMNGLLGIKYRISFYDNVYEYEELSSNNGYSLSYNKYALSPGFILGGGTAINMNEWVGLTEEETENPFKCQNVMFRDLTGDSEPIYTDVEYELEEIEDESARHVKLQFVAPDDNPMWLYCKNTYGKEGKILDASVVESIQTINTANGKSIMEIANDLSPSCTYLGRFKKGEIVEVELKERYYFGTPFVVSMDEKRCNDALERLQTYSWDITKHSGGKLEGTINVPYNGALMMITLPYIHGYQIYIDGVKTGYYGYRGAIPMIPLPEGEHFVSVSFVPPGLKIGIIAGIISFVILLIYMLVPGKMVTRKTKQTKDESDEEQKISGCNQGEESQ